MNIKEIEERLQEAKLLNQKLMGTIEFMDRSINELQEGVFDVTDGSRSIHTLSGDYVVLSHLIKYFKQMGV